ncbi:MAG TPA: sugar phosphate isomerase/epimerase, partial [Candidatus Hydrogenedentes bacterium]|nr:sugar phosphate isomerase/epimerase [Candidatus Hydrogenedentota bacterium]
MKEEQRMGTTRREFLGDMAALGGAVALRSAAESTDAKCWKAGLGLNGFMSSGQDYKKTYPIWEVLDFASREGFDGIELVQGWPMGPYPSADDPARVAALKRLYDAYGLQIYTIQNGGAGVYAANAEDRKRWLDAFRGTVRLCEQLGCDFVGHWPGGPLMGNADVGEAIKSLAAGYREAAQMCADAGMFLSFEIEPPFIFNTPEHLERILAETDHPACKTNYDPSHFDLMWGSKGKPEEML